MKLSVQKLTGLSLIEFIATVIVIAILAAIIIPLSSSLFVKFRRHAAITQLNALAVQMENYYQTNKTYRGAKLEDFNAPEFIGYGSYRVIIQNATNSHFLIVATPHGFQGRHDIECAALSLTESGEKGITGTGKVEDCWP